MNMAVLRRGVGVRRFRGAENARASARRRGRASEFFRSFRDVFVIEALTIAGSLAYIHPLGAPPLGARARLEKPLSVYTVIHPAMSSGHDGCAGFGGSGLLPPLRGRTPGRGLLVPGCLTSESEERETWTAESCAPRSRTGGRLSEFRQSAFPQEMRPEETSAVDVSGQHYVCVTVSNRRNGQSGTSSNVVISREKFSSNLRV
jgi:hypothetical protein